MKRFTLLFLAPLILLSLVISGCGQIGTAVQADVGKLQADLQAKKAAQRPTRRRGAARRGPARFDHRPGSFNFK